MTKPTLASVLHHFRGLVETSDDRRQSDQQLLERFQQQHDETAFTLLMRRHGRLVLSAIRRVLSEEADVEDAFQATFLVLLRKASSVRWQASMGNWLFGVAHRIAVQARANALRRQRREAEASRERPRRQDESADLSWREVLGLLHEELNRLPDKYRLPLLLCYLDGKDREETAGTLGCTVNAIKWRLERGRELLRVRLIRRGVTLSGALLAALVDAPPMTSAAPALVTATLNAVRTGAYRPSVAALMKAAAPALWIGKTRLAIGMLLTMSLLTVGSRLAIVPPSAAPESSTAGPSERQPSTARAHAKAKDAVVYQGRVLGPGDKPVSGANVYYYFITHQEEAVPVRATTDAQGRFAFTLTPKDIPLSADAERADPRKTGRVVVKADGFTFAWHSVAERQTNLTLHVAADNTPLTGRIIDLQAKPLAGVRVTVWSVAAPKKGDLEPFVKAIQSREAFYDGYYKHVPNRLDNPFYWRPRVPLLPATTTGADGRFRLRGFAKEQLVGLRIEGAAMETQDLYVMTRPAPRDSSPLLSAPRIKDPFFGPGKSVVVLANGFDYPVPPGLTVAGTVRDVNTKSPIPGAIVESYVLAGSIQAQNTLYHTVANDQGRYRFIGLPRGKGNRIRIRPPADQPFVPVVKNVPAVKLFTEATVDAALNRGVWVDATVADKATGRPVPGSVSYFVYPEKPNPERPFEHPFADAYNNFMSIRNDGTFRFVAVPRRAILAFRTDGDKYPIAREARTIHFPFGLGAPNFQAFAEINPKLGDAPVKVKFVLDAGRIVKGKLLDLEGRPLSGSLAAGLNIDDWEWKSQRLLQTANFTALGLHPDRPRLLCFVHTDRKLAGSVVVRGDEKKPITVKLVPWATVSGRLLDAGGKPIPNATLWFTEVPVRKPGQPMSPDTGLLVLEHSAYKPNTDPRTDEQGRFRIEGLIPGLKYNLALMESSGARRFEQIKWPGLVFTKWIFKPGESKELGDVKLQPFPAKNDSVPVRGRALGPDNKPVAGAKLYLPHWQERRPDPSAVTLVPHGVTDKDGRFRLELPRREVPPDRPIPLLAVADGFGLAWVELPPKETPEDVTLRLVKDVPIHGQLLTTEGKPVAGVTVTLAGLMAFERLDDFLRVFQRETNHFDEGMGSRRLQLPLNDMLAIKPTDKDGRFEINGVGVERLTMLEVKSAAVTPTWILVVTRADFDAKAYLKSALRRKGERTPPLFGPTFAHVVDRIAAQAEGTIEGVVREAGNGKPLAGATVQALGVSVLTDAEGRYRLVGMHKAAEYALYVTAPKNLPLIGRWLRATPTADRKPMRVDVELTRGVVVIGRVYDKATGKGVRDCSVRFSPLPENKTHKTDGLTLYTSTDAEGRFRLVTIPGAGVLLAQVPGTLFKIDGVPICPYKTAAFDAADRRRVKMTDEQKPYRAFLTAYGAETLDISNACKVLDVKDDGTALTCDLALDPGKTLTVNLEDAEGKPLAGAVAAGVSAQTLRTVPLQTATGRIYALDPNHPRPVVFLHAERKLTAVVMLRGDEKEPLTVRLAPAGVLTGRVLDEDGQPVAGAEVYTLYSSMVGGQLTKSQSRWSIPRTDKDGRFRLDVIVPGLKVETLRFLKGRQQLVPQTRMEIKPLQSGQTLDLGDLRTK